MFEEDNVMKNSVISDRVDRGNGRRKVTAVIQSERLVVCVFVIALTVELQRKQYQILSLL